MAHSREEFRLGTHAACLARNVLTLALTWLILGTFGLASAELPEEPVCLIERA